jgi:hypothetical protein
MRAPLSFGRRWFFSAMAVSTMSRWSGGADAALPYENQCERMRKKLVSLLPEPQRARPIGTLYLRSAIGQLAPALGLAKTVLAELGPDAGEEAIRGYIAGRIRGELQNVEVISLNGWILSPTEARLCGLVALGGIA